MKSRKNTMKRGGATMVGYDVPTPVDTIIEGDEDYYFSGMYNPDAERAVSHGVPTTAARNFREKLYTAPGKITLGNTRNKGWQLSEEFASEEIAGGGSKRKSRKSRKSRKGKKTKKRRGDHEGGKKRCPKHCRRKTSRTRKRLKHRKN